MVLFSFDLYWRHCILLFFSFQTLMFHEVRTCSVRPLRINQSGDIPVTVLFLCNTQELLIQAILVHFLYVLQIILFL